MLPKVRPQKLSTLFRCRVCCESCEVKPWNASSMSVSVLLHLLLVVLLLLYADTVQQLANINAISEAILTGARTVIFSAYIVYRKLSIIANKSKTQISFRPHLSKFMFSAFQHAFATANSTHVNMLVSNLMMQTIEEFPIVMHSLHFSAIQ